MLASIGYDATEQILEVKFVSNGQVWQYLEVAPEVFKALLEAPSKGKFMRAQVIGCYEERRIA
jgi:hypothetical protein